MVKREDPSISHSKVGTEPLQKFDEFALIYLGNNILIIHRISNPFNFNLQYNIFFIF